MAEYLGTVQLGGFYNNGTILKRPTRPWRPDSTPSGASGKGDIPQMSGSMENYAIGDTPADTENRLQWHKIKDGDKTLLVCDRVILVSVSWNDLNEQDYVTGRLVTIDGARYKCRLLTGGSYRNGTDDYSGGSPTNNEWDRFIANEEAITGLPAPLSSDLDTNQNAADTTSTHNQFWNWFYVYSWCQEIYDADTSNRVRRGLLSAKNWNHYLASDRSVALGFRPVLEVLPPDYRPTLGDELVGSTVKLKVDGVAKEFLVVHKGVPGDMYDASCDGIWLLMKDCYETQTWTEPSGHGYKNSSLDTYLNDTFLGLFDSDIQAVIKQVKLPYVTGDSVVRCGVNGLAAKVFLLSGVEVGFINTNSSEIPDDGHRLSYFEGSTNKRIANYNGNATNWWLRSLSKLNNSRLFVVSNSGSYLTNFGTSMNGVRPAVILPSTLYVSDDDFVITNTAPATPSTITIPAQINGGSTITVEWGTSTDAEDNLEGYKVERSLDGGTTWTQIYQGGLTSTTNIVPFGSESVMYRVKAYDAEGLESGWKASAQVTVINNTAPTAPGGLTVPEAVQGGQPLAISWGASTDGENNLAGYSLERQVDGGDWAVIYSGGELSFTDTITKGWQTVAYRVRAYDTANAYSGFAASGIREVNNNTPPAIDCEYPANTSLGVKSEGFSLDYSVEDEEGDEVTVTEAVDGRALRTFQAELGGSNSFQLTGEDFMRLLNGSHTLTITANDGSSSATHSLTFSKLVTAASITLAQPMEADGPISVCVLSVFGFIPADAAFTVEVTNNALDDEPVWEDCTAAVRAGVNHIFENETAANGFAFSFRLAVERGESGIGGYLTSIQGGFQ